MSKVDILAIGVHPDDVELCAAGTILRHISLGYSVAILDLTKGELGTRGTPELRMEEAANAAEVLGVAARENLGLKDGFFGDSDEEQHAIIRMIRKYRPDIVLANAVRDRHPDHGRSAELEARCCFLAGLRKIETSLDGSAQEAWRPKLVYHYVQDYILEPDICVDITDFIDKKMEAIRCFKSQFYDPDSNEPESPISVKDFLDYVRASNKTYGRRIGVDYAEGFTLAPPVRVDDLLSTL